MRKLFIGIILVSIIMPVMADDNESGFSISGGVKTGILIRNSDYRGRLGGLAHADKYPMTLFFASEDNEAYNGEGWLGFEYKSKHWGLNLSFWAHGSLTEYDAKVNLGDHYIWASFLDDRLRFIGGQGGGTPISTGGWLNADWLSYPGLRMFWVDPLGFSLGINFPDPDDGIKAEGIRPVNYLSMIMFGASYRYKNFHVSLMFNNTPIYDDIEANYDGGLHRPHDVDPIAQSGNIGFGIGVDKLFGDKVSFVLDGMVTNLGEDDILYTDISRTYRISPVKTILAFKAGYQIIEPLYAEFKTKYTISQGDNATNSGSTTWGKFEIEPFIRYNIVNNLNFEMKTNFTVYINSYFLALDVSPVAQIPLRAGQVAPYPWAFDYLSQWQLFVEPALVYSFGGARAVLGYKGEFSRDHVKNLMYIDFRWSF